MQYDENILKIVKNNKDVTEDMINAESKRLEFQEKKNRRKKEYHTTAYDNYIRTLYRKKNPKEVKKIEERIIEENPWLTRNTKKFKKLVDESIFESVVVTYCGARVTVYDNLDELNINTIQYKSKEKENTIKKMKNKDGNIYKMGGQQMTSELIESLLDELDINERDFMQRVYSLGEYEGETKTQKEIAKELGMTAANLSIKKKSILNKLKSKYLKQE